MHPKLLPADKVSFKNLLRINTLISFLVFIFFLSLITWQSYKSQQVTLAEDAAILLDHELMLYEYRMKSYAITLNSVKVAIEEKIRNNERLDDKKLKNLMGSLISADDFQYNIYFALEPGLAKKLTKKSSYVYGISKDIKQAGTADFINGKNFSDGIKKNHGYYVGTKEPWYQLAKTQDKMIFTDGYLDESNTGMIVMTGTMPLKDTQGKFVGAVALDLPISLVLLETAKISSKLGYRTVFIEGNGKSLEARISEKNPYLRIPTNTPEFQWNVKNMTFPMVDAAEITDANGKTYSFFSKLIDQGPWRFGIIRDKERALSPLMKVSLKLTIICIFILILQMHLANTVSNKIFFNTSKLVGNFKENIYLLTKNKEDFKPVLPGILKIRDLNEVRILWEHFLQEFSITLREAQIEKEKSYKAVAFQSSFLANMSHEIRTPMNAIIGMADILAETPLNEQQQQYLKIFKGSSENLLSLLNDILDVAKIEAGSMTIEIVEHNLNKIKEDTNLIFSHKAKHKNIGFSFDIDPAVDPNVKTDPVRLRQIIYNLVSNGIKFTESGYVRVRIEQDPAHPGILIKVTDTGIGIPSEKLESIFERFTQADASTTRKFGGTGLGLSIVRSLVHLMKGQVSVISKQGIGSCFTVSLKLDNYLPRKAEILALELRKLKEVADAKKTIKKMNVLVVDDVKENRMVVQLYLKSLGLESEIATNGEEAVEKYRKGNFHLVLMDIQMPVMDGVAAMKEIRQIDREKHRAASPVIALTAFASGADQEKYMREGFDNFVTKPLSKATFKLVLQPYIV